MAFVTLQKFYIFFENNKLTFLSVLLLKNRANFKTAQQSPVLIFADTFIIGSFSRIINSHFLVFYCLKTELIFKTAQQSPMLIFADTFIMWQIHSIYHNMYVH